MSNYFDNEKATITDAVVKKAEIIKNRQQEGKSIPENLMSENLNEKTQEEIQAFTRYYDNKKQLLERIKQGQINNLQNEEDQPQIDNLQSEENQPQIGTSSNAKDARAIKQEMFLSIIDSVLDNPNGVILTRNQEMTPNAQTILEAIQIRAQQRNMQIALDRDASGIIISGRTQQQIQQQAQQQDGQESQQQDQEQGGQESQQQDQQQGRQESQQQEDQER